MTEELDNDPESVARLICLQQLERKPRTRAELEQILLRRQIPDAAATAVLDRFVEVGLIDDAAYARQWVEQRHRSRGSSGRLLRTELHRKGIAPEQIAAALQQLHSADEEAAALALVERKLAGLARYDVATRTRRLVSLLARKGYSGELAYRVVRQVLE
ncbi:MAG: regulatory protein RecX [Mycobacteriales bacterium]